MGLLDSSMRVKMLASQKLDLESNITMITRSLMDVSSSISDLMQVNTGTDYTDPNSPIVKELNVRLARLKEVEKDLQSKKDNYQTRLKMVESELEAAKGMREKAISATFKY